MNAHLHNAALSSDGRLHGVIEPLANYTCAAERPRAALLSALRTLVSEVRMTQQAASAYVGGREQRR